MVGQMDAARRPLRPSRFRQRARSTVPRQAVCGARSLEWQSLFAASHPWVSGPRGGDRAARTSPWPLGPAGSAKPCLATVQAVRMLNERRGRKLNPTRPGCEAGERLGFLSR